MSHRNFRPCDLTTVHYSTSTSTPCDVWSFTNSADHRYVLVGICVVHLCIIIIICSEGNVRVGRQLFVLSSGENIVIYGRCRDFTDRGIRQYFVGDLKNKPVGKKLGSVYGRKVVGQGECFGYGERKSGCQAGR